MAVDLFHRLVVSGPHEDVDVLRRRLRRTLRRSSGAQKSREMIPFSFERLYELAPAAVRVEERVPCDPYDISVWPLRRLADGQGELRYKLHTRNLELAPFVRVLSAKFPSLTFRLVTHCADDGEIEAFRIGKGRMRKWVMPCRLAELYWERARKKFGLSGDEVYDDDEARWFAEEAVREEALNHWEDGSAPPGRRPRNWCNRRVSRDFHTEQDIALAEISGSED